MTDPLFNQEWFGDGWQQAEVIVRLYWPGASLDPEAFHVSPVDLHLLICGCDLGITCPWRQPRMVGAVPRGGQ